jgi:hypothetical protein
MQVTLVYGIRGLSQPPPLLMSFCPPALIARRVCFWHLFADICHEVNSELAGLWILQLVRAVKRADRSDIMPRIFQPA